MRVKTSELIGSALRWATAKADGREPIIIGPEYGVPYRVEVIEYGRRVAWRPDVDWMRGGPLIEKYHVQTSYNGNGFSRSPTREYWCAYVCKDNGQEIFPSGGGPSPLIAICRAVVAARYGDAVDVPDVLVRQ